MWAEVVRKRTALRKGLGHLLNRQLSRGWGAWVEMAAERATFMQKLRKGLGFMLNRKLAVGFATWRERVHGGRDDPMSKALRYFLNRNLARGWVCWHSLWEAKRAKLESMRRSLSHMLNRQLSRGFGAWFEMAVERAAFMLHVLSAPVPHRESR